MHLKRALIMTVGTGTRPDTYIVKPLVKSVRDSRPDFLALIVSSESRKYGEAIVRETNFQEPSFIISELADMDDFELVFQHINQVFESLHERGYSCDEIQIDFTSGTKAMSSGAVLSGITNQCKSLKYIGGSRKNGIVMEGTEKFITISPSRIFTLHDLQLAWDMVLHFRFDPAARMLAQMHLASLEPGQACKAENLHLVANGYRWWDIFDHEKALKDFGKVDWDLSGIKELHPGPHACNCLEKMARGTGREKGLAILLDLYNNALRRGIESKYDDAVARLYRATEHFAQHLLEDCFGIKSGDVAISLVPPNMQGELERKRGENGKVAIGLEADYRLLSALGHPAGARFFELRELRGGLKERNESILAHGNSPVTRKTFDRLRETIRGLIEIEFPEFEKKANEVQFPWVTAKLSPERRL